MRQVHFPHLKKRYQPWLWGLVAILVVLAVGVQVTGHLQAASSTPRQEKTSRQAKPVKKKSQPKRLRLSPRQSRQRLR